MNIQNNKCKKCEKKITNSVILKENNEHFWLCPCCNTKNKIEILHS